MQIKTVCPYSFGANTYIVYSGCSAYVIDPAVSVNAINTALAEADVHLEGILLTHGHYDHTISLDTLRQACPVKAYIHKNDAIMLTDGKKNAYYDFYGKECVHQAADVLLDGGDIIKIGGEELKVLHTPGHSAGSVCLVCDDFAVTGDTLFAESIGRCDLWSGSTEQIYASLEKLRSLPPTMKIYPGHGAPALLGQALDNAAYFF